MLQLNRREFLKRSAQGAAVLGAMGSVPGLFARPVAAAPLDEFAALDATSQAALVRTKQVTASELLEAAIARAEALNPLLNAIVTPAYDKARTRVKGELPVGPFTGVPTLLKDLLEYKDVRLTFGCYFFKDHIAEESHPIADRIEQSGMVVFGKTNTPEFGFLPTTESKLLGPAHNPWNREYSPGGSSGGSAVAVAAGIVPIAQASDGGGSIRVPASNCGLFGMKCTRDRFPELAYRSTRAGGLSIRGFETRSVRDAKAALSAIALTPEEGSPLPPLAYPANVQPRFPLRIAFATRDFRGVRAHPECVKAVENTAKLCERLGHHVEEAAPPIDGPAFYDHFMTFWSAFAAGAVANVTKMLNEPPPQDAFESWTWQLDEYFKSLPEDAVDSAVRHMTMVTGQMAAFHQRYDVWLSPVLGTPPVRIGEVRQDRSYDEILEQLKRYVAYTPLANATGQPAISVPLHWTANGLPVGAQFLGRTGEEALLFALAEQLEEAQPWADRWPPTPED